ncbi:MAG: phage integrase N-terminal SAM-like domain-containing protein [Deltaproteobacteria bacterium]|nr:phage integrase N-terminal SAM-like domain-containing protein [Deltaproteobacteria bacterium]
MCLRLEGLARFHQPSPDTLTNDQIQKYLRYLLEDRKLSWETCNNYFSGILLAERLRDHELFILTY